MIKDKPSKEQIELIRDIGKKVHDLATKENEIEICAIIPYSLLKTIIIVSTEHKSWYLLLLVIDMVAQLSALIDEIDIPIEAIKEFSDMGIQVV